MRKFFTLIGVLIAGTLGTCFGLGAVYVSEGIAVVLGLVGTDGYPSWIVYLLGILFFIGSCGVGHSEIKKKFPRKNDGGEPLSE